MATNKEKSQIMLGKAIRNRRLELSYSQEEIADLSKSHRTYIGDIERGERNVSLKNILSIAKALKIKGSDLLKLADL